MTRLLVSPWEILEYVFPLLYLLSSMKTFVVDGKPRASSSTLKKKRIHQLSFKRHLKKNTCPSPAISWTYWWWKKTPVEIYVFWFFQTCAPPLFLVEANSTSCPSPWRREPPRNLLDRSKAQLLHVGVRWLAALTKPCQWWSFSWEILAYRLSENMWKPWETRGLCGCVSASSCESWWTLVFSSLIQNSTIQQVN